MFLDTLAFALTFATGMAAGVFLMAAFALARDEAAQADDPAETQDEIFTGRFGRIWKDR